MPTPLSQGHAQLAEEHAKDTRDALGIEREALALQSDQSSGRAIALRQKQSMVMLQGFFDNLARTRRSIGRFILSILPELYDVESAMRTLGEAFLMQNFVMVVPDPMTGHPVQQFNQQAAMQTIAKLLGDAEFGRFDVAVGDNISSETIQYGQFLELMEMVKSGLPGPPDVLVEESNISEANKKKIIARLTMPQPGAQP